MAPTRLPASISDNISRAHVRQGTDLTSWRNQASYSVALFNLTPIVSFVHNGLRGRKYHMLAFQYIFK